MMGIATRWVYVESAGDEESGESFAWQDGKVLSAAQNAEREQLHRELEDIVERAEFDERAEWGRAVRSGDRLLVEVEATPMTGAARRLTATVVVSVARPDTEWASETAGEIAAILRDAEISIASDRLAQAFDEGWSRKTPFDWLRLTRVLAAAGAALTIAWWWMRSAGRVRKRRRAKVPTSGEQE